MARHIDLGRRKALHVRLNAAIHIESRSQTDQEALRKQTDMLAEITTAGDALWDDEERFDHSVRGLASRQRSLPKQWHGTELDAGHHALLSTLSTVDCDRCSQQGPCRGDADDHAKVTAHGQCIRPILDLLECLFGWCAGLHRNLGTQPPRIELSTRFVDAGHEAGMLGRFSVSGWHEVARQENGASIVGVTIRERHFDLRSALALYYILLHELLCHGFQSLDPGRERVNAAPSCVWSEGWMDELALALALAWLELPPTPLPEWINLNQAMAERISHEIHNYRLEPGTLLPCIDQRLRDAAAEAWTRLRHAWKSTGALPENLLTTFMLQVNVLDMSADARRQLGLNLISVLDNVRTARFAQAVGLCSEFAQRKIPWPDFGARLCALVSWQKAEAGAGAEGG